MTGPRQTGNDRHAFNGLIHDHVVRALVRLQCITDNFHRILCVNLHNLVRPYITPPHRLLPSSTPQLVHTPSPDFTLNT